MDNKKQIYLGIAGVCSHDAAAALVIDGKIIAAAEEERFIRKKHTGEFPYNAITFCLDHAGISPEQVDSITYYFNPALRYRRATLFNIATAYARIEHILKRRGISAVIDSIKGAIRVEQAIIEGYKQTLSATHKQFKNAQFRALDHHNAHAASAFFVSPFQDASILTIDLVGEWDTTCFYDAQGTTLSKVKSIAFPNSLGKLYQTFTKFLGFAPNSDEYKVMGLSAYGTDHIVPFFEKLYTLIKDGRFSLNKETLLFCKGIRPEWGEQITSIMGSPRGKNHPITQEHKDIAYALQNSTEQILLHLVNHLVKITGKRNLCMAGGVALNALANQKIRESGSIDALFVQPASNDAGTAAGTALLAYFADHPRAERHIMNTCYLGPEYSHDRILHVARETGISIQEGPQTIEKTINHLVAGKIVALFQGRMEFGPRALGNRSILADPRTAEMKDIVNAKVKFREPFRPFAPVILEDQVEKYFVNGIRSPFMTQTFTATELGKNRIPATVHQDGTSRIQTVTAESNPRLYKLLKNFEEKTRVPVLMNTSFNVAGEPIVCTPEDAINTFTHSGIDALLMEDILLVK